MTDEEFQSYLDTRYRQVSDYYDKRAKGNKLGYRICSVYILIVSGLLVPLISTGILSAHPFAGGLASATIVLATAIMAHFQFNENWLSYRATWDALQREPQLRAACLGEYATVPDRNALFVESVEAIASRESAQWLTRQLRAAQQRTTPAQTGANSAIARKTAQ